MSNMQTTNDTANQPDENEETQDLLIAENQQEKLEAEDLKLDDELATGEPFKTQDSDGHTLNPHVAQEQGLVYTPPTDPPVLHTREDPQGAAVATGFAQSMETTNPDVEKLPDRVDNQDLDLQENIYTALQNNSETGHLTNVKVQVRDGVVNVIGTVQSEDDIARVETIVVELRGVVEVQNNLQVEGIY